MANKIIDAKNMVANSSQMLNGLVPLRVPWLKDYYWNVFLCEASVVPVGVSLTWLLNFIATLYPTLPNDLNVALPTAKRSVQIFCLDVEVDEL